MPEEEWVAAMVIVAMMNFPRAGLIDTKTFVVNSLEHEAVLAHGVRRSDMTVFLPTSVEMLD